jgi:hypothetical protein
VARQARRELLANQEKFFAMVEERAGPADAEYVGQDSAKTFLSAAPAETQAVLEQAPPERAVPAAGSIIPEDCELVITAWESGKNNPKGRRTFVYPVRNGRITIDEGPKELQPAVQKPTWRCEAMLETRKVRATVYGDVVSGTEKLDTPAYHVWGWSNTGELLEEREHTRHSVFAFQWVLHTDGTLTGTAKTSYRSEGRYLYQKDQTGKPSVHTYEASLNGEGVWQVR